MFEVFLSMAAAAALLFYAPANANPDWLQIPGPEQFEDVYPRQAWREDVEGKAVLLCRVGVDTMLHDCLVEAETPADYGFGAAALTISTEFRMSPRIVNGKPVGGALVRVPITFKIPDDDYSIPDLAEALRCYVALADKRTDTPEPLRTREATYLWLVIQAHGLDQKLDAAAIDTRVKATRQAMDRGEISADWCA